MIRVGNTKYEPNLQSHDNIKGIDKNYKKLMLDGEG
jgi:hypothetical protein